MTPGLRDRIRRGIAAVGAIGLVVALGGGLRPSEPPIPANELPPELNTFSICARDPETGELGVAVTTRLTEVGRLCPFVKAGVGAVATQSFVRVEYGPRGLELLEQGKTPQEALDEMLKDDPLKERRQLGIIDASGRAATFTGTGCIAHAGDRVGTNYTVQGNLLVGPETLDAVAKRFEATEGSGRALADRLIDAMAAGQAAGGDKRKGNKQSAALLVADPRRTHPDGSNLMVNIQVAEHPEPIGELRRQYDTITRNLGYRTFELIQGPDIIQLKRGLRELGDYRPEEKEGDFNRSLRTIEGTLYDRETAQAVDRFRARVGLPHPGLGLGYAPGVVDREMIEALREAIAEHRRAQRAKEAESPAEPKPEETKQTDATPKAEKKGSDGDDDGSSRR